MKIYDNGVFMWEDVVLGMARAMVELADNFAEVYVDETAIDRDVINLLVETARHFNHQNYFKEYTTEEGRNLFYDLYYGKIPYKNFSDKSILVGESIYDDIRIFFE